MLVKSFKNKLKKLLEYQIENNKMSLEEANVIANKVSGILDSNSQTTYTLDDIDKIIQECPAQEEQIRQANYVSELEDLRIEAENKLSYFVNNNKIDEALQYTEQALSNNTILKKS
jgi:hypothetical protein